MEAPKEGINTQDIKIKIPKSYWIIVFGALVVYLIAFINSKPSSFMYALGVLAGGFVMSRLIEYFYSLITKNKNLIRLKLIQASLFLGLAILYLFVNLLRN